MENKQIFMFFADVVALAARHFSESPQAAPAEARPPESPADPTTATPPTAAPPTDARKAEVEREQDLTAEHLGHTLRCKGKGIAPEGHWSRVGSDAVATHRTTPSYEEIR